MGLPELFLLAVGLSMDAFAVSISIGLRIKSITIKKSLVVGLYFGAFQGGMPVIGYLLAMQFASYMVAFSPWIAFVLLSFLGIKLIIGSLKKEAPLSGGMDTECQDFDHCLNPKKMLPLAVATSIDALAVGVSFAFLQVSIVPAVSLIGIITLIVSIAGVKIGNLFGIRFKAKAEVFGGIILIGMGLYILLGHLLA
jgi:putative Mn2+ efflux pump MntP